jgi:uncharacterized protein (DUF1015 family)
MIHPFRGLHPSSKRELDAVENLNEILLDTTQFIDNFDYVYDFIENQQSQFIQDDELCYYIYRLESQYGCQTGIIALVDLNDTSSTIHPHENIKQVKSQKYIDFLNEKKTQANPVILLHNFLKPIKILLDELTESPADIDVKSVAGCGHKLWIIKNSDLINIINNNYRFINHYYIGDGHHRYCAAKNDLYGQSKSHLLCWLISDNQACVFPCHWIIPTLGFRYKKIFIKKIEQHFDVSIQSDSVQPKISNQLGLYIENTWYHLQLKQPKPNMHISIFMHEYLKQEFGINNVISTYAAVDELTALVNDSLYDLAFSFPEINITDLLHCVNAGHQLPVNTTYFVPKPAIGLISYCFATSSEKRNENNQAPAKECKLLLT